MSRPNPKTIVIGSGFGGLAAAIRLAARGHRVTILEKLNGPGGRAYAFKQDGFIFDAGPTVITVPHLFDELFALAGKRREDAVQFIRIDPFYRIFDHEGRYFEYNDDEAFVRSQIRRFNPADQDGYSRFLASTRPIFEKGFVELGDVPFLTFADMLRVVPDLLRLRAHQSVYRYVSSYLQDDFLRRAFTFHPLLIGGNPLKASSIYAMIHYIEHAWGVYYAEGGTQALVHALLALFQSLGGEIVYEAEVTRILTEGRKAKGVRLQNGETIAADYIISNADLPNTYMQLIDPQVRSFRNSDFRYRHLTKYSMSLVVIYVGTNRRYTDSPLAHHNIIFSERYQGLLKELFAAKTLPKDFSLYVHMPTRTDPSVAPPDHEAFYFLSPVPHLGADIDWETVAPEYRERILTFLEEHYLPDLRKHIVTEHMIDPRYFQDTLGSYLGAGFSVQPLLTQSAYFRPHNRSEDIDNLYFVGAGTHPGAGLPGVVSSAKIVERLIAAVDGLGDES